MDPSSGKVRLIALAKVAGGATVLGASVYAISADAGQAKGFVYLAAIAILLVIAGLVELAMGRRWSDLPQGLRVTILIALGAVAAIWLFREAIR